MGGRLWKKERLRYRTAGGQAGKGRRPPVFSFCDFSLFFLAEEYTIEKELWEVAYERIRGRPL